MTDVNRARYHVLLVGVDDYKSKPLGGCVNDIDEIQRILLSDRMTIPSGHIRRLASPLPSDRHPGDVPSEPATLDNLRNALHELASPRVQPDDRVFIYFAGHGTRIEGANQRGQRFHREALIPADFDPKSSELRLLYDFEVNERLGAIVQRTRQVSLVLDCCHAAGAVRDALDPEDWQPRCLDLSQRAADPALQGELERIMGGAPNTDLSLVEDCHVVAACLGHQRAQEGRGADGVRHGLLSRALVSALDEAIDTDLPTVTWGRIWHAMYARMQMRNPGQHPMMIGHAGRAVFGGPPTTGDPGIPVTANGSTYRIEAGTMARVTIGATIAVYPDRPPEFPRLDSSDDRALRVGVLEVIAAERDTATATPIGPIFELPHGVRGRVIRTGTAARLRCAVLSRRSNLLQAQLRASPLLEVVADPMESEVQLEDSKGRWFVTDSVHGVGGDRDRPPLFALQEAELDCARDILEHYSLYARPLQMAALATDLAGQLDLHVLSCPQWRMPAARAQMPDLERAPSRGARAYAVAVGAHVCFQVHNASRCRLRVTLLNSAASGRVQLLGDEVIDPKKTHTFWANSALGVPFEMTPPRGASRCIDRLVAIGRTAVGHDLGYLRVDRTFADVIGRSRSVGRGIDDGSRAIASGPSEPDQWTADQVVIETGVRSA
jgi:hypothetical protein